MVAGEWCVVNGHTSLATIHHSLTHHSLLLGKNFNSSILIQGNAAELAAIFCEMHRRDNNVVFGHSLSRQAGSQIVHSAKDAVGGRLPLLQADSDALGNSNALPRLEPLKHRDDGRRNR